MTETTDETGRSPDSGEVAPRAVSRRAVVRRRLAAGLIAAIFSGGVWLALPGPRGSAPPAPLAGDSPASTQTVTAAPWKRPDDHHDFIGTARCAACHHEIAMSFAAHPMGRSAKRISSAADFLKGHPPNAVPGDRWVYDTAADGETLTHHERMLDSTGQPIYDVAKAMAYAVGSGKRAIAFLHQVTGEPGRPGENESLLLMSPLNWYTNAARWDFAPGYTKSDARRFDRRITDECLSCHVGRVAVAENSAGRNLFADRPFHEIAIGCENCHGPGRQHAEAAAAGTGAGDSAKIRETIVNPEHLSPSRKDAVCYQCHLQAAARVPRRGRSDFDFRPGMALDEVWTHFDSGSDVAEDGKMRSVNQVQQMRESRCFVASEGKLGCVSCHDPHSVPAPAQRLAHYRDRCRTCHTSEKDCTEGMDLRRAADDSCIACHMPTRGASNVAHISLTDHRVLRRPHAATEEPASSSPAEETLTFFDHADQRLPSDEQKRAVGLGLGQYFSRKGTLPPAALIQTLVESLRPAAAASPRTGATEPESDGDVLIAIASMALQRQDFATAYDFFDRATRVPGFTEPAFSGLMDLYALQERWSDVIGAGDRVLQIDPEDFRARALRGQALVASGRAAEGFREAERALELHPSHRPLREWLIEAYRKGGQPADADRHQELLDRIQETRPAPGPE